MNKINKRRLLQRMIALVLVAALLWQTDSMRFFSSVFAEETQNVTENPVETLVENTVSDDEQAPVTVLGEVETLRTQDEKHFRMSDGSYMAVSYGMPVHYQDADGQWQEIDNRLVLSEDQEVYQTSNLQTSTNFASSLVGGNLFETSYGDTSVSMSLLDTVDANILMKSVVSSVDIPKQNVTVLDRDTDSGLELELSEIKQGVEIQIQDQEILTELVEAELLTFDRTTIADISVEVEDVIGDSDIMSQTYDYNEGWTMEDILPENIQDSLLYEDVFSGVDLLYTKYSHNVKEQIIVKERKDSYRYDFKLSLSGVEAELNTDGSVSLKDVVSKEEIYYIPAPYMEDANGRRSYDAEYVLTSVVDGVVLTIIADADWMNESERVFPVAIDPTLVVKGGTTGRDIFMSYSAEGTPNVPYEGETYIGYTMWNSMKEYQAFAHFSELPKIPEGMTVVQAVYQMIQRRYDALNYDELGIGVYEVTQDKPSSKTYFDWIYDMTWNTRPTYDEDNMIDYTFVSASGIGKPQTWDITELVKKWYIEKSTNCTIAMTMVTDDYDSTHYASASFYEYNNANPPILAVYYRDTVGIEPYYTYQTIGVSNAGTAYIADATGQLKVVNTLVTLASTANPFALSLVYNSDYFQSAAAQDYQPPVKMGQENVDKGISGGNIAMKLGAGWTLDIIQTMHTEKIGEGMFEQEYLCYRDGDGTKHYFVKDDERNDEDDSDKIFYYDEDGLGLKAEITEVTNGKNTGFVMYDDSGNTWTFSKGRLIRITDEAGNRYNITYNSDNRISTISQFNKNYLGPTVVSFTYSGDYVSTIKDLAGNTYSFTYTGNRLTAIARNGTQIASYVYQGSGNLLTSMGDTESGYTRAFGYSHGKIIGGSEHVRGQFGNNFSVSYPNYSKTVYRTSSPEGELFTSYLFDYSGRTINAYVTDGDNNILGASNAVYADTQVTASSTDNDNTSSVNKKANRTEKIGGIGVTNPTLFHYGNCESAGWILLANTAGVRTVSYDSSKARTGVYSLKMVSQNTDGATYVSSSSLSLSAGETYTLSAYVRTTGCIFTGEGVTLKVTDGSGNSFTGKGIAYATASDIDGGWTRIHITFTAVTSGVHTLSVYAEGITGTFYVDDVQLEEGNIPGTLNLLKNGSMETNPWGWNGFNGAGYSADTGWNNSQSMKIAGDPVKEAYIRQDVSINLPATETFVLSGWAIGNSVPDNVTKHTDPLQDIDKQFGLRARLQYADGTIEYHYVPFNPEVSEWQFASLSIVPRIENKNTIITSIRVICTFEGNANAAYFDNICLSREVAQTLKYDEEGNLQSVNTPGLDEDVNSYEGSNLITSVTGGNGTYTYSYDETYKHRLTSVTDGVITQNLSYDQAGNVISTTLKSNDGTYLPSITTSVVYGNGGNHLTKLTDSAGNQISYAYGTLISYLYGLPTKTTDGRGNSTSAIYDNEGKTTEISLSELMEVAYSYNGDNLTSIERINISEGTTLEYYFGYDAFGRTTAIDVGGTRLASYTYRSNGDLVSMTYANGTVVSYFYDILGRVIKESHSENGVAGRTVEYFYDNNGQIYSVIDSVSGTTNYIYDKLGRLAYVEQEETGVRIQYRYDSNNRLVYTGYQIDGLHSGSEQYGYNSNTTDNISDGTMTGMQLVTDLGLSKTFDELQRLTKRTILGLTENYTYTPGEAANTATTQISGKKNTLGDVVKNNFQYTYDGNGNILTITDIVTGETITYSYDIQNQLIGAVYSTGRTESYSYDSAGNILSFNNGTTSHTYTYGNDNWADQLMAVDGVALTYDSIGNPLTYYNGSNYSMSWTEGRKLATITVNGETTSYLYDADGIRIKKINSDGSYIQYVNAGGLVLGEKHYSAEDEITKAIRYIFDDNGAVCGYMSSTNGTSWTQYYFITNLQGDILHVYRANDRAIMATYCYDSWGNIISKTGDLADENPFRYRGYYYDAETGFFATGTRYYDPEIGRFINADAVSMLGANRDVASLNLFAYCGNNSISRRDAGGYAWETVFDVISLATSVGEVVVNPYDPWAWAGLVGDVVDVVVPFVGGIGEAVDVVKTVSRVVDKGDDIIDAAKNMRRAADAADDIKDSTGAYVVLYEQGQHYIGKGGFNRAITSATEHMTETNKVSAIIWAPTPSKESAFVTEYLLQSTFGLKKTYDKSYNLIWSPGRKLLDSLQ